MRQKHLGHRRIGFPKRLDQVGRVALLAGADERDGRALQQGLNSRLQKSFKTALMSGHVNGPGGAQFRLKMLRHLIFHSVEPSLGPCLCSFSCIKCRGQRRQPMQGRRSTLAPARPVRPTRCT